MKVVDTFNMNLKIAFPPIVFLLIFPILLNAQNEKLPNQISENQIEKLGLSGVCYQESQRKGWDKKRFKSTAFFISKNILLTSAHNISGPKKHPIVKLALFPSKIGKKNPYKPIIFEMKSDNYYRLVGRNFIKLRWRKRPHDFALLYIPDSIISKNETLKKLAYLPLLPQTETLVKGDTVYCAGYPAINIYSKEYVMTLTQSIVKTIYRYHFTHRIETYPGNSGSPIMVKRNGTFHVVGVHSIAKNGTWLNKKRQKLIQKWIKELAAN